MHLRLAADLLFRSWFSLASALLVASVVHDSDLFRLMDIQPSERVTATEFGQVCASLADLCHDLVGTEVKKRKAEEVPQEQRNLIERTG